MAAAPVRFGGTGACANEDAGARRNTAHARSSTDPTAIVRRGAHPV